MLFPARQLPAVVIFALVQDFVDDIFEEHHPKVKTEGVSRSMKRRRYYERALFLAISTFPHVLHCLNRLLELDQIFLRIVQRKAKGSPNLQTLNGTNSQNLFGKLLDRAAAIVIAVGGLPLAINFRIDNGKQFLGSHVFGAPLYDDFSERAR
jgi:hypothetical protein